MSFHDVQRRLATLLRDAGCERYTARQALADVAKCWHEIRQDSIEHGGSGEEPFFNFVVAEGVGVFAIYGTGVEFYVIRGEEADLRDYFNQFKQLTINEVEEARPVLAEYYFCHHFEPLAMTEVDAARAVLAERFKRASPDLVIEPPLSRAWLLSSGAGFATG